MYPRPTPPKPLTPAEVMKAAETDDAGLVDAATVAVNNVLRDWRGTGPVNVAAKLFGPNERVRQKVLAAFRSSGWKIEYVADQRDGDFYTFPLPASR